MSVKALLIGGPANGKIVHVDVSWRQINVPGAGLSIDGYTPRQFTIKGAHGIADGVYMVWIFQRGTVDDAAIVAAIRSANLDPDHRLIADV